jgi:hypothetical protein
VLTFAVTAGFVNFPAENTDLYGCFMGMFANPVIRIRINLFLANLANSIIYRYFVLPSSFDLDCVLENVRSHSLPNRECAYFVF